MHAVVYEDGALEAKCARDSSQKRFLKGAWSGQRAKRTSNGATRASKSYEKYAYEGRFGGEKSVNFDATCITSIFKNVIATDGGKHIFAKSWKKNELQ